MALQLAITYKGLPVPAAYTVIDSYQVTTVAREVSELVRTPNPEYIEGFSPLPITPYNEYLRTITKKIYEVSVTIDVFTDNSKTYLLESRKHNFEFTAQSDITFSKLYMSLHSLAEYADAIDV